MTPSKKLTAGEKIALCVVALAMFAMFSIPFMLTPPNHAVGVSQQRSLADQARIRSLEMELNVQKAKVGSLKNDLMNAMASGVQNWKIETDREQIDTVAPTDFVVLDGTTAELVINNFQGALTWFKAEPAAGVGPAITWYRPIVWQEFGVEVSDPEKDGFRIAVPEGAQACCLRGVSVNGPHYTVDFITK